jgi:hypothetical protein
MIYIFKWIVFSNIWIALSVVSLIFYGAQIHLFELSCEYILIAFFATLFAYNFQRIEKSKYHNPNLSERHIWINNNVKTIKNITILSMFMTISLAINYFSFEMILTALFLSFLVFFYTGTQWFKLSLRSVSYLKTFLIAIVWTFVVVIFPSILSSTSFENENYVFILMIFLFITTLCIPFDIRDLKTDKGLLKTIPSYLGIYKSKILAIFLFFSVAIFSYAYGWIAFSIVSCISGIVMIFLNEQRKELFYTGLLDGLMLLFPVLHLIIDFYK